MSALSNLLPTPPDNFSTTLNGSITSTALSIVLNSVSGLPTEGVGVIYAKDSTGAITANSVEFIHWTGISSSTLTLTDTGDRGLTGSANGAQTHASGDTFEVWVHANSYYKGIRTAFLAGHTDAGAHATNSITSAAIVANAVTNADLSNTVSSIAATSATWVSQGVNKSFTTTGGQVVAMVQIDVRADTAGLAFVQARLKRDTTVLYTTAIAGTQGSNDRFQIVFFALETPAAGTYTYNVELSNPNSVGNITTEGVQILLIELKK